MKLISFFHTWVRGIFVSQRKCVLEIAGDLKENRLDKTGCERVRRGELLGLSATQWRPRMGIASWYGHQIDHLKQIVFPVCEDFLTGCREPHTMVSGPLWEQLRLYPPPWVRR